MNALGLILARAGSKGVPGKNTALVAGQPCVRWTIEEARRANALTRCAVSTDDPAAQRLALDAGMDVVARPEPLASDAARIDDAARHALEELGDATLDPIVILYANVPVRPPRLIDRAVELLVSSGADSVQSYAPVGKHHPLWTVRLDDASGEVSPWQGDTLNNNIFRRQDLPDAFVPDGGVLVVTRRALMLELDGAPDGPHAFLGVRRRGIRTGEGEVVDIDSRIDLLVADAMLRERTIEMVRP